DRLRADLDPSFHDPAKKYLVFYDAPVDTPFDCGQSAIEPDTGGPDAYSFVYLQAQGCTHDLGAGSGVAGYVAHELLHNLGAVPDQAPHICFEHSVCDWYWDVETQFPTGDPLWKLILDHGRDDYYGHSGSWFDVQDSPWLSHVGAPLEPLTVSLAGRGGGSVASSVPGISCPAACSIGWEQGTSVVLHAGAASGSRFFGWSGACAGTADCTVTMDSAKNVNATFAPARVSLAVSIKGRGTVTSSPRGITCPGRCRAQFSGAAVLLRARAHAGWRFAGWSGTCRGRAACAVPSDDDHAVTATFRSRSLAVVAAQNPIQQENALPGTSSWGNGDWTDSPIEGYASETSVAPGDMLHLHVSSPGDYRVEIFRLGWYGGVGGRLVACLPGCLEYESGRTYAVGGPDPSTGEVRLTWPVTDAILVPAGWVSGYYLARLVTADGSARGTVPFVVREGTTRASPILVDVPTNTWQAYNSFGGKSLYDFNSTGLVPANRVSFDRPYLWQAAGNQPVSKWELPAVRFLEREGYDVSYATDGDIDRDPSLLLRHRVVIVLGHGEYWTKGMRDAYQAALAAGTNLAFLGANIDYWQVRYEDGGRTMVGYKSAADPEPDPALKTVLFRDLVPPRPECALLGVQHYTGSYAWPRADFRVVAGSDPWLAGTGLTAGSTITGVVSREHDQIPAGSPAGTSCGLKVTVLFEHIGDIDLERAEAVRYAAPSGARVFSAGSYELAWALDSYRVNGDGTETPVDPRVQQFVRNVLADLQTPAAPASVSARRLKSSTLVSVAHPDPRVAVLVFRHAGAGAFSTGDTGVRQVCRTTAATCLDRTRLRPGLYRYAAVLVDAWATSPVRLSGPVRVRKVARK
ncbi:MAG TPA: N,N-dimethylformamidase beta subunit family domain-containing protein, partial [Gaiellaceae bacterium]|nr:N,N-dimethylformamidase beta subunit family domain-containing protein [Gaiellaceae bacterium]